MTPCGAGAASPIPASCLSCRSSRTSFRRTAGQSRPGDEKSNAERKTRRDPKRIRSFRDEPLTEALRRLMTDQHAHDAGRENYSADYPDRLRCSRRARTSEEESSDKNANRSDHVGAAPGKRVFRE